MSNVKNVTGKKKKRGSKNTPQNCSSLDPKDDSNLLDPSNQSDKFDAKNLGDEDTTSASLAADAVEVLVQPTQDLLAPMAQQDMHGTGNPTASTAADPTTTTAALLTDSDPASQNPIESQAEQQAPAASWSSWLSGAQEVLNEKLHTGLNQVIEQVEIGLRGIPPDESDNEDDAYTLS